MALLRNPRQMGAVFPSGSKLAEAMASMVDPKRDRVLELGPGTGSITQAILARGLPHDHLTILEKDPNLSNTLTRNFAGTRVICGDASHLPQLLAKSGHPAINCVVSSLPLLNLRRFTRYKILLQIFKQMNSDGKLIQFTYSLKSPISESLCQSLNIKGEKIRFVSRNIPPASVWEFKKVL
ncbi:class I SAM-dependent methyltransferase [Pleionea sediminis]|uniref:class I SAM-dependent methyltransferase n=1 Tax=Pleionea sediminis TaxID=2569479 RepID=UPI0013DD9506|nr:rRNA adenine N-6-methyltransferase family protein [Pleionea sediminis]